MINLAKRIFSDTYVIIIFAAIIAAVLYSTAVKENSNVIHAFENAGMGIPSWVAVEDAIQSKDGIYNANIKYGIGGKTCHSFITIEKGVLVNETNKRCDY